MAILHFLCSNDDNESRGNDPECVTCTPCPTQDVYDKLKEHCINAYQDCIFLCEEISVEWNEHVLNQQYIEVLSSSCHYVTQVVIFDNSTSTTELSFTTESTSTSTNTPTATTTSAGVPSKTTPVDIFNYPLWIAAFCLVSGVSLLSIILLMVYAVKRAKIDKNKSAPNPPSPPPPGIINVKGKAYLKFMSQQVIYSITLIVLTFE